MTVTAPSGPFDDRRRRRAWWVAAAVVAVVIALVLAFTVLSGDDDGPGTNGTTTTSTTGPGTTTSGPTTTTPPADATVVWPAPGSTTTFATPEAAARSFAVDFLHFRDPVVGAFAAGDSRSGEVPVQPRVPGPVTTVIVRQVGAASTWSVLGAATAGIDVTAPATGAEVTSPLTVAGSALAFEGNVLVEVREDGVAEPIGHGFVTGGGDVKRPFTGRIEFRTPTAPRGSLVLFTDSAENGEVWEAAVLRIAFGAGGSTVSCAAGAPAPPTPAAGEMDVKVFFTCDPTERLVEVHRAVPRSTAVLRASFEALLAGPTPAERSASIGSWFSDETKGMLRSATITGGHAVIDFDGDLRSTIPNASASAGSARLLAELDATVFQFASVTSAEYRLGGSCQEFNEWLQFGGCDARTRPGAAG